MQSETVIDDGVVDEMLKLITKALLQADVNVKMVSTIRKNIKANLELQEDAPGINRRKLIQQAKHPPHVTSPRHICDMRC